ncbi:hypothetical protein [Desulfobacula sp.]|uniref:hypothetical protein n=1 Tax=Desulfobacula sp. TaxID=2593537 RepID=UPI00263839D4|nr:hypothetical protein [Desulfobacula sp.]
MAISQQEKDKIKKCIVACLKDELEIQKVIVFGSFLWADNPNDIDVAVLQNSSESYLPLAMKYRKKIRIISKELSVDIIPLRLGAFHCVMGDEISRGEVIFER